MDIVRDWVSGVAAAAVLAAVAMAVTPQGSVRKVVALCAGLLLAAAVVRPVLSLGTDAPDIEGILDGYGGGNITGKVDEALSDIIAGQTAAYIVNKAQALGIDCSVTVKCRMGEYYPEPWSVTVRSKTPEHAMSALGKMIENETGIPPERQKYALSSGK